MAWCNPGAIVPRPRTDALELCLVSAIGCAFVRGWRPWRGAPCAQWRKCGMSRRRAPSSCVPATPARELVVAHLPLLAIVRLLLFALRQLLSATTYITLPALRPLRVAASLAGRLRHVSAHQSSVAESGGHYCTHCSFSTQLSSQD